MIRTIRFSIFFVALWFLFTSERTKFSHITIKDGLSQSSVKSIIQDSRGYMWFGSADGLNKYDGYGFKQFHHDPENLSSISGNDISCIYENPYDSAFWIGTRNAGLNLYNRERDNFNVFTIASKKTNNLPSNSINDILATPRTLWIATRGGLCYYNPSDSNFVRPAFIKNDIFQTVNCLEADNEGNLWLGTPSGLYKWRYANKLNQDLPEKIQLPGIDTDVDISALKFDLKGNLWIGTRNDGLFRIHPKIDNAIHFKSDRLKNSLSAGVIYDILERKNGEIWIGTATGLCKYVPQSQNFDVYRHQNSVPESLNNDVIYELAEDQSGILWVGTYLGGINKVDPLQSRFAKYDGFSSLNNGGRKNSDIRSIAVDKSKVVWLGSSNGLIEFTPAGTDTEMSEEKTRFHLTGNNIVCVFPYENSLLVSSNIGILEKTGDDDFISLTEQIRSQTGKAISGFYASMIDDYKQIWLCTTQGLLKYNPSNNQFELYRPAHENSQPSDFSFLTINEDNTGKLWLGTIYGKLFTFDKFSNTFSEILTHKTSTHKIYFSKIFSVCTQIPNEIWIGTNLGLYQYLPETNELNRFLTDDGLANNVVYGVIAENNDNIWCTTNLGLSRLNTKTYTFKNYTYQEGLQSNEFNQGAYYIDGDDKIYIGGIEGLNIFDPKEIITNSYIPNVIISNMEIQYQKVSPLTHLKVLEKQISEAEQLQLNYKQNSFSFEFTALSFSLPQRNQYQYALTKYGEEDHWIHSGNRRIATYTNIPPGRYTFSVKGSNSDGIFNETPTIIQININPPFWRTWWFTIILALSFIGSIYLLIYMRIRRINRQKRILKRLVKEKTKTLVNQTKKIELQNEELRAINVRILNKTENIKSNNKLLNEQHIQITAQRDKLLKLAEKVESSNQSKFRFFTSVSHELRTPLTLLIGPLKDLVTNFEQTNKKDVWRKLKNIYSNSSKLLLIVNQLLDFRKTETDNLKLQISHFELITFIQKCASLFKDMAAAKKIDFNFESETNNLKIWADQDMLEKTIFNLLSNAFEATPQKGTICIKVASRQEKEKNFAVITVRDTGVGIEGNEIPLIFERFHKISKSNDPQVSGSGLGLALVKNYVDLHNGLISVNSTVDVGTEFIITIPTDRNNFENDVELLESRQANNELLVASIGDFIPPSVEEGNSKNSGDKSTLLLIENNRNLKIYLKEILLAYYTIIDANSAGEGFQIAKSKKPELIVSDVMLPDSDGFSFCEKLKLEFYTSHIPVILLTSLADNESHMKGIKAGADAYISKPFDLQLLILTIENLIEGRRNLHRRFSLSDSKNIEEIISNSADQIFIKKAIGFVEKNLTNGSFSVDDLCNLLKLSQPQCYRKIKAITGYNISEFIRNTRLKEAAKLLKSSDDKISEVAFKTGFNDPNYFTKSFIKLYGISPKEFAKSV